MEVFDGVLGERPNQIERKREDVEADAAALVDIRVPGGKVTEAGLRNNVSVALQYLASWLGGNGAVAIFNLMEDAATAEISRSQVWQWQRNRVRLDEGPTVTPDLVREIEDEELEKVKESMGEAFGRYRWDEARRLFETVALADEFDEFLTLPAYREID
jgi:malate synthase